jgi:MoaA/NifB/PqqE/SkfB family radical SAM enzyme
MTDKHKKLTEQYSTWGDKLLQHTDVLNSIQNKKIFKPITIQLAPCEVCDSDCPFCSVADRPLKSYMPYDKIQKMLEDFISLGAKSLEITGGGNPMLYRDKATNHNINDIISYASKLGYEVGLITNSHNLKRLNDSSAHLLKWVRISLIKLDEGKNPEDYSFKPIPYNKLGFSYIIYNTDNIPDELSRTNKVYTGTTKETINKIVKLVKLHPEIKFVRLAGDCLDKRANIEIQKQWKNVIDSVDNSEKFFIKDIYDNNNAFPYGCYVGLIRPYIAPDPRGGDYQVYICTSHVLNCRNYDLRYSLGSVRDIKNIWGIANAKYKGGISPYELDERFPGFWNLKCKHCYYYNNNKLLHTVANELPDKNFP